jgi:hypothetical protein
MRRWHVTGLAALVLAGSVLGLQNVSTAATDADRAAGEQILAAAGYSGASRDFGDLSLFDNQIKAIVAVQDAVLAMAPRNEPVAFDREREPRDLIELKYGFCFDRSRAIEKMLDGLGLETRHVAVYSTKKVSWLAALVSAQSPSHALSEVKTAKGWMLIDSNARWVGLTANREPVGASRLKTMAERKAGWAPESKARINGIFLSDFIFVRGLYSRHGRFFAPYVPLPDVNYLQLAGNLFD